MQVGSNISELKIVCDDTDVELPSSNTAFFGGVLEYLLWFNTSG